MRRFLNITIITAVIFFISGCCHCKSIQKKNMRSLVGTEWKLIQLMGQSVKAENDQFTISFSEDGRLSGVGACNRIMGSYSIDQKRGIKIGQVATTMMACPGMDQEYAFTKVLGEVTHYEMDGPMLLLLNGGELQAVFQAQPKNDKK